MAVPGKLDAITSAEATLAICQLALRGIPAASYGNASACTEFTVSQVAEHRIGSIRFIGGAAGAASRQLPAPGAAAAPYLEARAAAAAQPGQRPLR
jgi:hypothetical protein